MPISDELKPRAPPDPGRVVAMMVAFEQTATLNAAIQAGLFTAIAQGADTVAAIADRCGCAPRGVRVVADVLCVYGLLQKAGERYTLAEDAAAYLDVASPAYIGEAARFLASPEKIAAYFDDPLGWLRRGGPVGQANTAPQSEVWVDFARGMAAFMAPFAKATASALAARFAATGGRKVARVLDVAAGHGLFGLEVARVFPDAGLTALDWPAVVDVARETVEAAGLGARFEARAGSAFEVDLGSDYDLVLIPNFLHHFSPSTCVAFLKRVHAALAPGGMAAIVEFTPDEDRIWPPAPALFALSMLTGTPEGDAYTARELCGMCKAAGLGDTIVEPLAPTAQTLITAIR